MIYLQCMTHVTVRQSVVRVVILAILRDPADAEKTCYSWTILKGNPHACILGEPGVVLFEKKS